MAAMAERRVGFADNHGTVAGVEVDDDGSIRCEVAAGLCSGCGYPTPEAARQFAAALLDAADRSDAIRDEDGES